MKKIVLCVSIVGALSAGAQTITWQTPQIISGDSDVSTNGTYFGSWAPGDGGANGYTVDGVTFQGFSDLPDLNATGLGGSYGGYGSPGTADPNYNALLAYGVYGGGSANFTWDTMTPGDTYLIEFWVEDARVGGSGGDARWENLSGGTVGSAAYGTDTSGPLGYSTPLYSVPAGNPGYYIIGTFVADGDGSEEILLTAFGDNGNSSAQINLFQVRDITGTPAMAPNTPTASPADTNDAGVMVTLGDAGVTGEPPIFYQWQNNGVNIDGATNSVLTFTTSDASDSVSVTNSYALVVSNSYGTNTSPSLTMTVTPAAPPVFSTNVTQPPTLFLNDNLTVSAGVSGTPPISLQWQLNDTNISGATNETLTLIALQPSQSGTLSLVASNAFGPAVTNSVTLTVEPYLQFTWFPPTTITTADATLELFGGATNPAVVFGATDFGQVATTVSLDDSQSITFEPDGSQGGTVAKGNGTIYGGGNFGIWTGSSGNANFDIVLDGNDTGIMANASSISFYNLTPGNLYALQIFSLDDRSGNGAPDLVDFQDPNDPANVSPAFLDGANDYALGAFVANETNQIVPIQLPGLTAGGSILNAAVVYALPLAAEAWDAPAASPSTNVDSGTMVTFSDALVTGLPPISYQWQANGVNLPGATNGILTLALINTNNTLVLTNAYALVVANSHGTNTSPSITMTINPVSSPEFTTNVTQPPTLFLNDNLTLVAGVSGSPPLYLQWQLNGVDISGATNASLTLTALQASQSGTYALVASNQLGSLTNTPVTLTVEPFTQFAWSPPAPITTADATLGQIGTVAGAADFSGQDIVVTLSDGTNIDFTGDTSVASVAGNATYNGFLNGLALTTNANFNAVLNGANYDGGVKVITLNNLTPGNLYAVQLFAVEDRWGDQSQNEPIPLRQVYYQDPNDTNNVSQTVAEGDNDYVVGTFTANATTQVIFEQLPGILGVAGTSGAGNANALVVYSLPQAANAWLAPIASPASTVPVGTTVTLSDPAVTGLPPIAYQWQTVAGGATNIIPGATNNVLVLANVPAAPPGSYELVVANSSGTNTSPPLSLDVENEPLFTTNGAGWTLNGGASISNGLLTLTDGGGDEQTSFFFDTPMYIGAFQASFTYQATGTPPLADGMTFCLQNSPFGAVIVGDAGGELGFGGITNSAAMDFNINTAYTPGYAFTLNGQMSAAGPPGGYTATGSVNLGSGDPINVGITYDGNKIGLTLVDSTASVSFATNIIVGPLGSTNILGADTAYVGFTAGTGAESSTQTVTNFTFTPLALLSTQLNSTNNAIVISWPTAIGGYVLQRSTDLASGNSWITAIPPYPIVNGQYQVTESATGTAFYRLQVPP